MLLTRYGIREWSIAIAASLALGIPSALLGWWPIAVLAGLLLLATVWFFRDPPGRVPAAADPLAMASPADGVVSAIVRESNHSATGGEAVVIRIFLSVLDVHVNRAPASGEVIRLEHRPGRYLDARSEASARLNESNLVVMKLDDGRHLGIKQISGAIARRIVCPLQSGQRLERGQRFGMIKVGSTTELVLPDPDRVEVLVKTGQRVVGGVTILARMPAI